MVSMANSACLHHFAIAATLQAPAMAILMRCGFDAHNELEVRLLSGDERHDGGCCRFGVVFARLMRSPQIFDVVRQDTKFSGCNTFSSLDASSLPRRFPTSSGVRMRTPPKLARTLFTKRCTTSLEIQMLSLDHSCNMTLWLRPEWEPGRLVLERICQTLHATPVYSLQASKNGIVDARSTAGIRDDLLAPVASRR